MAYLEKVEEVLEIIENGDIQIKKVTIVLRDGLEIARTAHRSVLHPGDPYDDKSEKVQAIASIIHTEELIAQRQAEREAMENLRS